MLQLQSAEVPAAMAHNAGTLLRDPHLCARQFFQSVEHPEAGKQSLYGPIWRFDGTVAPIARHAPLLGGDSEYVLRDLLGLSEAEYQTLVRDRVVY